MPSFTIDTTVDIGAGRDAVWGRPDRFASYKESNPVMRIDGAPEVGTKLVVRMTREDLRWLGKQCAFPVWTSSGSPCDWEGTGYVARMEAPRTRAKATLYVAWLLLAASVVVAGRSELASGALLIPAGALWLLATRWGVVNEYDGSAGLTLRWVTILSYTVAIGFVLIGATLIDVA